jgi:hypothetical protein
MKLRRVGQDAIYELCKRVVGPENECLIDGGGCDSGDALDFTLSEIRQAIGFVREEAGEQIVSLTQERDNWKMKCEQLQFAVKHYSGPTTEGVGMQAKPSAAKSERTHD